MSMGEYKMTDSDSGGIVKVGPLPLTSHVTLPILGGIGLTMLLSLVN